MTMRDQVALITGASAGIGAALARELARRGMRLVLCARRADKLESLATELRAAGTQVIVVTADVTRDGDLEAAVDAAVKTFGGLDVAVANAGFGVAGPLSRLGIDDVRRQLETNFYGVLRTFKASHEALRKSRGRLVLIGSVAGFFAVPGQLAYSSSKFAVRALAEGLGVELAADGISVTHIVPGFIESEIRQIDNQGRYHADAEEHWPRWLIMPAAEAARQIADATERRERQRVITRHGKLVVALNTHAPGLVAALTRLVGLRGRSEPR